MIQRCYDPHHHAYKDYGGRGITVCPEWKESPEQFARDVGSPPSPSHSIDRIDNDLGYFPSNVRWSTKKQQASNRRTTVLVVVGGEALPFFKAAEAAGVDPKKAYQRMYRYGWNLDRAIPGATWPIGSSKRPATYNN